MRNRLLKSFALFALLAIVFASYADNDNGDVVDLGLPSGVKWATCNVGATNPWDYGNHYAWGETKTKGEYKWSTYKYCNGGDTLLTKYCDDASYGNSEFTDTLTTLETTDDVATAVLGSDYSMPTIADWEELSKECYWVWTNSYNGTSKAGYIVYKTKCVADKGHKVYSGNIPSASYSLSDIHIFLPAAGNCAYLFTAYTGSFGYYWSASLYENYPNGARLCFFRNDSVDPSKGDKRCYGQSVRPIRRK